MRRVRVFSFIACLVLVLAAPFAHAASISGTIGLLGTDSFTSSSVTFTNPAYVFGGPGANTGSFSVLSDLTPVTMLPTLGGGPVSYSPGFNVIPSGYSPLEFFTVTSSGGTTFAFWMTDYDATYSVDTTGCTNATCLSISGDGFFTGTGYDQTPGTFTFTSQLTDGQSSTTFSASTIATPEPSSIALLGTGMLAAAGALRRRLAL